jgi:2-methylaconitate cis-trans-isomerase PrpF
MITETIQVGPDGLFQEDGTYRISGVKSTGSPIKMTFVNPAGSMTGKLFPTGNRKDSFLVHNQSLYVGAPFTVQATMIDAANPFIFVDSATLPEAYHSAGIDSQTALDILEAVRREGAVRFGLAADTETAALVRGTPKIAVLSSPQYTGQPDLVPTSKPRNPDIHVTAYSMGKVHPSFQLTGAVCLGSALSIPGTIASDLSKMRTELTPTPPGTPSDESDHGSEEGFDGGVVRKNMVIAHRTGQMEVLVNVVNGEQVKSITVFRTARRLFEGNVLVGL